MQPSYMLVQAIDAPKPQISSVNQKFSLVGDDYIFQQILPDIPI